jgi:hypothetical protein
MNAEGLLFEPPVHPVLAAPGYARLAATIRFRKKLADSGNGTRARQD